MWRNRPATVLFLFAASPFVSGAGASLNAGPTCATCHEKESRSQPETPMARAMLAPDTDPLFQKHPKLTLTLGTYTWQIERQGTDVTYTVSDGANSLALPVRWIFGEASQTFVLEYNNHFYESRVTFYPEIDKLDFTVGNQKAHLGTITEVMGREVSRREIFTCFECHSTGAIVDDRLQPASATLGIQCEHCHRNAIRHQGDIVNGKLDSVPPKLGLMATEDTSNFCGQCHRSWGEVVRGHMFGLTDVRFQPYRLTKSKCYDGSDPRISCLACHDPHNNLITSDAFYEAKCLACHPHNVAPPGKSRRKSQPVAGGKALAKACPVASTGCIGCHMPKTQQPGGPRILTDHFIRVVHPGEPFPE
jgi:hypothetical protein